MAKVAYDTIGKKATTPKTDTDVAEDLYTQVGKKFPMTWYSDGTVEYDDSDLTEAEKTAVTNFLTNL